MMHLSSTISKLKIPHINFEVDGYAPRVAAGLLRVKSQHRGVTKPPDEPFISSIPKSIRSDHPLISVHIFFLSTDLLIHWPCTPIDVSSFT